MTNTEQYNFKIDQKSRNNLNKHNSFVIWFTGLSEFSKRFKLSAVYDLSATPYYLNGSGYDAYSLTFGMNGLSHSSSNWASNQWGVDSHAKGLPLVN